MKKLRKTMVCIILTIIMIFSSYVKIGIAVNFTDQNKSENDVRKPWPLKFSQYTPINMEISEACFEYNNIYCVQHNFHYTDDDTFIIKYGIDINGNTATLYKGSWNEENKIASWENEANNIFAGILTPTDYLPDEKMDLRPKNQYSNYTIGLRLDGGYGDDGDADYSIAQYGVYQYWKTFESEMNTGLANYGVTAFDFGFEYCTDKGNDVITAVQQMIQNYDLCFKAKIVLMDNTNNSNQNVFAVKPDKTTVITEKTEYTVEKVWVGDEGTEMRPSSIQITLYGADGKIVTKDVDGNLITNPVTLTAANASSSDSNIWTYTFTNLPSKTEDDTYIKYYAEESVSVSEDIEKFEEYKSTGAETINGCKFVNRLKPTLFKVTKIWDDDNDRDGIRPTSLTLILKANGEKYKEITLTGTGNYWTYEFYDLPLYINGKRVTYTVEEIVPEGYYQVNQQ